MARFVDREVENRRDNPTEGEHITLVLGVAPGHSSTVKERVTEHGGEIVEDLPFNSLLVQIPEMELEWICGISELESIELDEGMEILSGN